MLRKISNHPLLVMFLFVTLAFGSLAWRYEQMIERTKEATYQQCLMRGANVKRLNQFYQGMANIERHNPYRATSPKTIHQRIQFYESVVLDPADCSKIK